MSSKKNSSIKNSSGKNISGKNPSGKNASGKNASGGKPTPNNAKKRKAKAVYDDVAVADDVVENNAAENDNDENSNSSSDNEAKSMEIDSSDMEDADNVAVEDANNDADDDVVNTDNVVENNDENSDEDNIGNDVSVNYAVRRLDHLNQHHNTRGVLGNMSASQANTASLQQQHNTNITSVQQPNTTSPSRQHVEFEYESSEASRDASNNNDNDIDDDSDEVEEPVRPPLGDWHMNRELYIKLAGEWETFRKKSERRINKVPSETDPKKVEKILDEWYHFLCFGAGLPDDDLHTAELEDPENPAGAAATAARNVVAAAKNARNAAKNVGAKNASNNAGENSGNNVAGNNVGEEEELVNPMQQVQPIVAKVLPKTAFLDYRTIFYVLFDIRDPSGVKMGNSRNISPELLYERYDHLIKFAADLFIKAEYHHFFDQSHLRCAKNLRKINSIFYTTVHAYHMIQHEICIRINLDDALRGTTPSIRLLHVVSNVTDYHKRVQENKGFPRLVLVVLQKARSRCFRRYGDDVYQQTIAKTDDGKNYPTHYWHKVMPLLTFVHESAAKETDYDTWKIMVAANNAQKAQKYFVDCVDMDFPKVIKDRHVFSFKNGIYFAAKNIFRPYAEGTADWADLSALDPQITAIAGREKDYISAYSAANSASNAAAKYFDLEFKEYANVASWKDIPTPTVDKIFSDQDVEAAAQNLWWALLGRMIYDVGEYDNWQLVCWIRGTANSGKSTLCKIPAAFYDNEDVAVLSNNIQENFGLSAVHDKFLFIAPEVKKDFKLNQAEFQQMVVGEHMAINRKFQTAMMKVWKVPGMFSGNTMPGWMDHSDSVTRRIAMINFQKKLKFVDQTLDNRLRAEMAHIILKSNRAYQSLIKEIGKRGIWELIPQYFKTTRETLKAQTHPIYNFFQSDQVMFGPDCYMLEADFKNMLRLHCRAGRLEEQPYTEDLYMGPFLDRNLTVQIDKLPYPRGSNTMREGTFIFGVEKARRVGDPSANGGIQVMFPNSNSNITNTGSNNDTGGTGKGEEHPDHEDAFEPPRKKLHQQPYHNPHHPPQQQLFGQGAVLGRQAQPFQRLGPIPSIDE